MKTIEERTNMAFEVHDEEYEQVLSDLRKKADVLADSVQEIKGRLDEIERDMKSRRVSQTPSVRR